MDPISLIVGALAAGAAKGVGDTAASAVGDVYRQLKALVRARVSRHPKGEGVLVDYEDDPETYEASLVKVLRETRTAEDATVLQVAQRLLEMTDPAGAKAGKYTVSITDSQGVQVGDGNAQRNTFG